jgi:hypothetical protein
MFDDYIASALRNAGWSSPVARQAHNLKAAGSNPAPATNFFFLSKMGIFRNTAQIPHNKRLNSKGAR